MNEKARKPSQSYHTLTSLIVCLLMLTPRLGVMQRLSLLRVQDADRQVEGRIYYGYYYDEEDQTCSFSSPLPSSCPYP